MRMLRQYWTIAIARIKKEEIKKTLQSPEASKNLLWFFTLFHHKRVSPVAPNLAVPFFLSAVTFAAAPFGFKKRF